MSRLFPQAHLSWAEPKALRRAMERTEQRTRPWLQPVLAAGWAALLMVIWWQAKQVPDSSAPPLPVALALAAAGAWLFTYGFALMYRFLPSRVQIFDYGIATTCGNNVKSWKFEDIDRCEIASVETRQGRQSALVIHTRKVQRIVLGVPPDIVPQLIETLKRMNVKVESVA